MPKRRKNWTNPPAWKVLQEVFCGTCARYTPVGTSKWVENQTGTRMWLCKECYEEMKANGEVSD